MGICKLPFRLREPPVEQRAERRLRPRGLQRVRVDLEACEQLIGFPTHVPLRPLPGCLRVGSDRHGLVQDDAITDARVYSCRDSHLEPVPVAPDAATSTRPTSCVSPLIRGRHRPKLAPAVAKLVAKDHKPVTRSDLDVSELPGQ